MERPVVVAVFDRGELQSVRVLSPGRERWAAMLAAAAGAALVLVAMAAAAALVTAFGLVVHAPTFFLSWLGVAAAVGSSPPAGCAPGCGSYRLGADIEADAFAMAEVDWFAGRAPTTRWGWCRACPARIEHARSSMPIEAFTRTGPVHLPLPPHGQGAGRDRHLHLRDQPADALAGAAGPLREWLSWLAPGASPAAGPRRRAGHAGRGAGDAAGLGAGGAWR